VIRLRREFFLVLLVAAMHLGVGAYSASAQDQTQPPSEETPKPAGSSVPIPVINSGDQQDQNGQSNLSPDANPLTGVVTPTLGAPEIRHSYWVPGVQWSGVMQSNSYNQTANSAWLMNNFLVANLSLLQSWSHSQLNINYSGGGFFSTDSTQGNGTVQQLAASQSFQWNRWQFQLLDEFSYLPQTSLGFGGGTGLGVPGIGGSLGPVIPGIGGGYVPNQSIYLAEGPRYSNASVVQMTYMISPRGSLTVSGSYGVLNFVDAGNVDDQMTTATIGYNYLLSREASVGLFYQFGAYHFSGQPDAYGSHSLNFAYGRKLTGRLALQTYIGPLFTTSRISTNGDTVSHGVNVGASLTLGFRNGNLTGNYNHGISGGSGILNGSTVDQMNFGLSHGLSRVWSGQINVGYGHNTPIEGFGSVESQAYNTWNFGGGVSRPFGRNVSLAIAYNATITKNSLPGCTSGNCDENSTYNYVTINFQWHSRPFVLP